VPHRAVARRPVTYTSSAWDTWSGVASYTWSFGDGSTASGPVVDHTFKKRGTYAVTFKVTDGVGNTTTRTTSTKVVPRPVLTTFKLVDKQITTQDTTRLRIGLNLRAKVKVVLRSKHRLLVHGRLHRVKVILKATLPRGPSVLEVVGADLRPDTWVVTGTARKLGVDSAERKQKLRVGS
jgi:PKD repeat protein